jgi:hypothetical protein
LKKVQNRMRVVVSNLCPSLALENHKNKLPKIVYIGQDNSSRSPGDRCDPGADLQTVQLLGSEGFGTYAIWEIFRAHFVGQDGEGGENVDAWQLSQQRFIGERFKNREKAKVFEFFSSNQ